MKNKILLFAVACIVICTVAQSQNVFPDSGFVGIGTDDPEAPLELGPGYDYMIFSGISRFGTVPGTSNITFGFQTFQESTEGSNANIAFGQGSQKNNTTGEYNISMGLNSLVKNTTGSSNISIGELSSNNLIEGDNNIALGERALYGSNGTFSQFANDNIAIGYNSLYTNGLGNENIALGKNTMFNNLKGNYNTALGCYSLDNNIKGNYNTALGYSADAAGVGYTNATVIGYNALVDASNKVRIGNASVTSNGGQVSWTAYSDARIKNNVKENVPGLEFIKLLKPVTYHFDVDKQNELMGLRNAEEVEGMYDIEKIQWTGFLAQEVDAAAKKVNYDFSGVDNSGEIMGLRYSEFVVPLVKAVQELSIENEELKMENEELKNMNAIVENINEKQQQQIDDLTKDVSQIKKKKGFNNTEENTSTTNDGTVRFSADANTENAAMLGQNVPNPFDQSTLIPFRIPKDCNDASMMIMDVANGKVITVIPLSCNETHITVDAGTLASGTYAYTLIVDGNIIATKQMVLTK